VFALISVAFNPQRRGFQDYLADSAVVDLKTLQSKQAYDAGQDSLDRQRAIIVYNPEDQTNQPPARLNV
jgi:hypothetical protein